MTSICLHLGLLAGPGHLWAMSSPTSAHRRSPGVPRLVPLPLVARLHVAQVRSTQWDQSVLPLGHAAGLQPFLVQGC